eukprot:m.74488 g.74488  ORF g.74488 m.74488 type:complete len:122 (-) comp50344_c0_seq1:682-1047(-)
MDPPSELRFKVVMLGDAGVGKSCFLQRGALAIFQSEPSTLVSYFFVKKLTIGSASLRVLRPDLIFVTFSVRLLLFFFVVVVEGRLLGHKWSRKIPSRNGADILPTRQGGDTCLRRESPSIF